MRLVFWFLSLKRQKPRDPSWYWENQERWNGAADEAARVKWMTDHRNERLGREDMP